MLRRFTPRNDSAFTLAEVLITLVIIGVVAALTIPNLMQKYQEQTTVKKVQKFYSNLSNAYSLAMKENGPASEWGLTGGNKQSSEIIYEILFKPYFKIAKNCGGNNTENCLANDGYIKFNNSYNNNYGTNKIYYKIALNDGAAVWFRGPGSDLDVFVDYDINGIKKPNQIGKDTFEFYIKGKKILPSGTEVTSTESGESRYFDTSCKVTGWGCAAWVIYKGNMDYLHCEGLTWNSRSCKDK